MKYTNLIMIVAMTCALAACGNTKGERALSGGAIGAGTGAVVGGITGGSPVTGALIGGAGGAAVGAFTDKDDIDMGDIK